MPTGVERLVRNLRLASCQASLTDCDLLMAFADEGDERAFAEVVSRHGALVLGVCRRVLGNDADADDAFQATFLVLARKAGRLAWEASIKNWLHGVACRVALKARGQAQRRRHKEQEATLRTRREAPPPATAWDELRGVLDEELARLPARQRAVLVLCCLEGKTRDEAAEELGWPVGSVKGCLEPRPPRPGAPRRAGGRAARVRRRGCRSPGPRGSRRSIRIQFHGRSGFPRPPR
jgi:RNA polymerase sigma factor (sigma-70 family)